MVVYKDETLYTILPRDEYDWLVEMLDNPPAPTDTLKKMSDTVQEET